MYKQNKLLLNNICTLKSNNDDYLKNVFVVIIVLVH